MPDKKKKLLVVDDEKDICEFVKRLFKKEGFIVYSALSGAEAVALANKVKPNVALLDIYLKTGMNGIDTLRKIREIAPECRCVMVTWDNALDKIRETKKLGAISYLTKPLTVTQLLDVVSRVMGGKRKRGK